MSAATEDAKKEASSKEEVQVLSRWQRPSARAATQQQQHYCWIDVVEHVLSKIWYLESQRNVFVLPRPHCWGVEASTGVKQLRKFISPQHEKAIPVLRLDDNGDSEDSEIE
jgi:hypothetical protein